MKNDSECHFVLVCPVYKAIGCSYISTFTSDPSVLKFITLMKSEKNSQFYETGDFGIVSKLLKLDTLDWVVTPLEGI